MAEAFNSLSTSIKFNEIEDILVKYATRIALDAERNLRSNKNGKDSNATGSLAESIKVSPVEFFGSNYSIEISMNDYWQWVNDGRGAGKRPPVSKIIQWIKDKQLRLDDKGVTKRGYKREGTLISASKKKVKMGNKQVSILEATAYKIAAKIGKYGTKGTDFLTDAIADNTEDLVREMKQASRKDIVIQIKRNGD
tara:strand:+ start:854 stop:1438 length:585 start_codon:yes stop_codon:yes gene_type:complete